MSKINTHKAITAIIPAAGKPTNTILSNSSLPDAMIPINGKPVIGYIIEDLISRKINNIVIVLNREDAHTEHYVSNKFESKASIKIVHQKSINKGVGYAIKTALTETPQNHSVLVYLGDTIYKGNLSFAKSFLIVSKEYEDASKWCFVEKKKNTLSFINKPRKYKGNGDVLSGLYFFKKRSFLDTAAAEVENLEKIEMSDLLLQYQKNDKFVLIKADRWYDCGNIDNYNHAKVDFLKIRSFNSIFYNSVYGYITKRSTNKEKIKQEINWFLQLPTDLQIFTPRLVNYTVTASKVEYSLEFYGYQTLADMFTFGFVDIKVWKSIIGHLFAIHDLFKKHTKILPHSFYEYMYLKKTVDRIKELKKDIFWKKLLSKKEIIINGKSHVNIIKFLEKLPLLVKKLQNKKEMSVIHGDPCLSNILFDPGSKLVKLIDPRGQFGENSVYGDSKYDIAKLRHSFHGNYDFIVSDLFSVKTTKDGFVTKIFNEADHSEIAKIFDSEAKKAGYNLSQIRLIEALLFLSMIPLHADHKDRQLMMYLTGVQLIQEFI